MLCSTFYRTNFIQINGIRYSKGCVVVLTTDDVLPVFGLILEVLLTGEINTHMFICEVLETIEFVDHNHAYKVSKRRPAPIVMCTQSDLSDYHILGLYQLYSVFYIVLKYYIV